MKQYLKYALLLLLTLSTGHLYAKLQGQPLIDSLLKELPKQKEDTNKVKLLNTLSFSYSSIKPDDGIKYAQQELELASKLNWKKGIAMANNCLGLNYKNKGDNSKALAYFNEALKIDEEIGYKKGISMVDNNIAMLYNNLHDYPKTLEYYLKAIKINEELGDKAGVAIDANVIGQLYSRQNDYTKALEYIFKALKIHEELGNKSGIAMSSVNFGSVYLKQNDYPKALEYSFKALKLYEELADSGQMAITMRIIGNIYLGQKDYLNAKEYLSNALKINQAIGNKIEIAYNLFGIGNSYYFQKDYSKALEYDLKSLKIYEELGIKSEVAGALNNIAIIYQDQKNYTMAIEYMQKVLTMGEELGDKQIISQDMANIGECYLDILKDGPAKSNNVAGTAELSGNAYKPTAAIPTGKAALMHNAIDYLQRGLVLCKELNDLLTIAMIYGDLGDVYKIGGDYKKAIAYGDSAKVIKDSLFSEANQEKIEKLEKKRKEFVDSLKAANEQKAAGVKATHRRNYELIGVGVLVLLLGFTFLLTRNNKLLGKEKKRSDDLLLNILPEEVASQLKDTGAAAAKQFDNVTVLFTDFVNFTEAGERMKPEELIEELNTCFKKFDEITAAHNIEKIKTIGDAYLAVAGLPTPDPKHAENVVRAAKEISAFMQDRIAKVGNRTFEIRIGVHSGSVVAGIVGIKKFAYDIWGDTVNTAARMEQNSEPGRINISETTYELVKDKIDCEYRGEIDAKGKGMMKMYYISRES